MRILITGVTGFIGGHLAEHLHAQSGYTLYGLSKSGIWPASLNQIAGYVTLISCDVNDEARLQLCINEFKPEQIYHLAGYASTQQQDAHAADYQRENVEATKTLLNVVSKLKQPPRVLFTSTGLVYGNAGAAGQACTELAATTGDKPYPASKLAAERACLESGLPVIIVRLFNQIGPRQSTDYAVPKYAKAIAIAERTPPHTIETKFLSSFRDFTDIRDMVAAFALLMKHGVPGEIYNAGSGQACSIQSMVDVLLSLSQPKVTATLVANAEPDYSLADVTKLKTATGWQPRYTTKQTLHDVLNYWRQQESSPRSHDS